MTRRYCAIKTDGPEHTMHPSHSFLTDARTFMPRIVCSGAAGIAAALGTGSREATLGRSGCEESGRLGVRTRALAGIRKSSGQPAQRASGA